MMNLAELQARMDEIDGWAFEGNFIVKEVELADFKEALYFVNKIGELAEKHQHHPSLIIDYNHVRISLTTHSERGVSEKDFALAKEIDLIK
jgi:4a-hydroxytetrahydrobiopterin dehydratase